ncbi:O-antigen ligase family protein [Nitrospirota bacterium]
MLISDTTSGSRGYSKTISAYWWLLAAVIVAPLAFGSVELWSLALMQLLVAFGILAYLGGDFAGRVKCYRAPGMLPLLMLLMYMVFQAMPVPPSLLEIISPSAFEAYSSGVFLDSPGQWVSLSLYKRGLLMEFLRLASYAGIYFLTVEVFTSGEALKRLAYTVAVFASILAFMSILARFSSGNSILWLRDNPWGIHHFGPYINKNHYAGFMGMVLPLVVGLFVSTRPRVHSNDMKSMVLGALNSRRINRHVLLGAGAIAIFVSILLSMSRSSVVAMIISIAMMALLVSRRRRVGMGGLVILFIAIAISIGWFGVSPLLERFVTVVGDNGLLFSGRRIMSIDSLRAAGDFIVTGGGFGAFAHIYPAYRTMLGTAFVDHAHNDYMEFLVEGGGGLCCSIPLVSGRYMQACIH